MFFFGIFGIQDKVRQIKEFTNIICTCGRYSSMKLMQSYTYFHIFFIPLFKWNKKYYIDARCCGRIFEVPDDYADELLQSDNVDMGRLKEINVPYRVCPNCGAQVDSGYRYCPYCGKEI